MTQKYFWFFDPEYLNYKSPCLEDFLNNHQDLEINSLHLESEIIIAKDLLSKNKNEACKDGVHNLYSISKYLSKILSSFSETLKIILIIKNVSFSHLKCIQI